MPKLYYNGAIKVSWSKCIGMALTRVEHSGTLSSDQCPTLGNRQNGSRFEFNLS